MVGKTISHYKITDKVGDFVMRDGFTDHTAGTKLGLILGAPPRQVNERWRSPCGQRSSILAVSAFQERTRVVLRAMHGARFNMTEDRTFLSCVDNFPSGSQQLKPWRAC